MDNVLERFLRYVAIDTQSDEEATTFPSTEKQKDLARLLADELSMMGADDVYMDEEYGYVYASIKANDEGASKRTLGFISHMDTSPESSGSNIKPRVIDNYDGKDIVLNEEKQIVLRVKDYPEISDYVGQRLVVTDGTTLLGADDKAGVSEIMAMAKRLLLDPSIKHGKVALAFTPDEEIGAGVDHFDLKRFGADVAYTVDGGGIGELEYENFNAASATVNFCGVTVHPGEAKDKMKNASLMAMEFDRMLTATERPEHTENYEGFYHMMHMEGEVEAASLSYIVRDHDRVLFEEKKSRMLMCESVINERYGEGACKVNLQDSYYNMKEMIDPDHMDLIKTAIQCMEELGITPKVKPIRGGTDGARLSFMGLPCPNICTGGHNFHGRFEYVCVDSMEKVVDLLVSLVQKENAEI